MRNLLSLTFVLLLVTGSVGLADAGGHKGSHLYGGTKPHGKGGHYYGGIGPYGRKPREHHPRPLKSCTERHPCIKRRVVAPVVTAPAFVTPVTPVAPPAFVTPVAPIQQPAPVQPAPVDATTILTVVTFVVVTFATAAFLLFRALAALAKYIGRIPMRLLRARDALAEYIARIPMRLLRALAALAKYIACIPIRWIAGRMRARSLRPRHTRSSPSTIRP